MRVGLVVEYLHARGGTQRQALELAVHLQQLGHTVRVFCGVFDPVACFPELTASLSIAAVTTTTTPTVAPIERVPARLRQLARGLSAATGARYLLQLRAMRRAARALRSLLAAERATLDVLNPHDFGPAAWAADAVRLPAVWQCNDPLGRWDTPRLLGRPAHRLLRATDRARVRGLRHVTVLDTQVARVVAQRYDVAPRVVRSGVDLTGFATLPDRAAARRAVGLPATGHVALVLALLNSPHRRVEDAIAAHARGPDRVTLLLAAPPVDATCGARVANAIAASPARARIVWHRAPLRGEAELRALFAASDALVFPNAPQTWGLAVIEAAAAGLPVVVSRGAGVSEVFTHDDTASLFEPGNVPQLTAALAALWRDPARRRAMATRGQAMVHARFSWRRYAEDMQTSLVNCISPLAG